MWTLYILGALGAFIAGRAIIIEIWGEWGFLEVLITIFCTALGTAIGICVGLILALIIPIDFVTVSSNHQLEALQDNIGSDGAFFLGCGTINSNMCYVFYEKIDEDTFKAGLVDYDDAEIKYINDTVDVNPYLVKYRYEKTDKFINNFTINFTDPWYIFYVPRGSIKNSYTLDAK